jgi:hypothetical protein
VKRTGRGESIGAVTHICIETTQGISLCSYLYVKHHVCLFIFYVFSSTKLENRRMEQVLWVRGGALVVGRGENKKFF